MLTDLFIIERPDTILPPSYTPEQFLIKVYSYKTDTFTIVNKITTKDTYIKHFNALATVLGNFDIDSNEECYTLSTKVKVINKGYIFNTVSEKVNKVYLLSLVKLNTILSNIWTTDTASTETASTETASTETASTETASTETASTETASTETETASTETASTETETASTATETETASTETCSKMYNNQECMNYNCDYNFKYPQSTDPFCNIPYIPLQHVQSKTTGYGDNPFVFNWNPPVVARRKSKHVFYDLNNMTSTINEEVKTKLLLPNYGLKPVNKTL
jgi:hypothetical protein